MRAQSFPVLSLTLSVLVVGTSCRQPAPRSEAAHHHVLPGPQPDGSVLLPNLWSLRPAGQQIELGDFPVNVAVHPGGRFAAVLHCGYSKHQIVIVDVPAAKVVSRTPVRQAFYGLEFSPDGKQLFCSGAGDEVIHAFEFQNGALTNHREIKVRDRSKRGVPAGLAVASQGRRLYVANLWADRVSRLNLAPAAAQQPDASDILLRSNAPPPALATNGPPEDSETAAATKRAEAALDQTSPEATFPYACRVDERRGRLYVSLWAQAAVAVIDLNSEQVIARWPTQEHPCEMALTASGRFLFVANANRNTVSVIETDGGRTLEIIWAALSPEALPGSTPNSLALSPDEKTLFVANACNNAVAVFDVSTAGKSRSLGFIPVGWYPTSVRVTPDGKQLLVANGKGITPKANPLGPQPGVKESTNVTVQYIGRLFSGTLGIIPLTPRKQFEKQLKQYTGQAYRCSPQNGVPAELEKRAPAPSPRPAEVQNVQPVPRQPGQTSLIKYCLYIIKENRTYDQVLGDLPQGNGDPKLCLFPERVTPNHHQLARQFVLLDNFYVDAEVSADGHEWSMGAYATDFVEKMWPLSYGHNRPEKFPYPAEGNFPIATPASGYLWDRAHEAGVSYRSYGEFVSTPPKLGAPATARLKTLQGHIDPAYRGFDLEYADVKRAERFIAELKRYEDEGEMPRLQILRLPNDHTHGSTPLNLTPTAYVADNDLAFGQIVEAVSHSKFWSQTAIFVLEDDAQNGPDHVDAHRSIAFVISPYARHGAVDSTMYTTSSMLRTIELILGLKPMSQFDAAATPMFNAFQAQPDLQTAPARPANVDLKSRNPLLAWGGKIKMDFSREDAADDLLLNETIWRSVRGPDHPMPAPVRAGFVLAHPQGEDRD